MENKFLDKVEDNFIVHIWSEKTQLEKGDSLAEGYTSELWDYTRISVMQNSLQELKEIWDQWSDKTKQLFYYNYGDLPYLFDIKVDEQLFQALAQYWNPAYSCFIFGKVDLVPTMENLQDLILAHPDMKKKVDMFALSIYGLMIFPGALEYVDEAVSDLFDRLGKGVAPVPTILSETFRSLNAFLSENYSPLKEIVATLRKDDISEENWIALLRNLQEEDIEWRASWLIPDKILYRCGSFGWVPLLGIWRAIGYASLLVEAEILRKGKNKDEEDFDSLKMDYKKLRLSMRTAGLGKTSE
ncbi:hypothetical protein Gotri_025897 [Gossypium trilobum]|uniref:DUF7745 domain-containing protein n=1 Tax=Gossypium trilobum TaxID=34281 RepID=A0A7J9FMQ3_9ROSI|nr:hypothetical protein [Gossypium trilobum]